MGGEDGEEGSGVGEGIAGTSHLTCKECSPPPPGHALGFSRRIPPAPFDRWRKRGSQG